MKKIVLSLLIVLSTFSWAQHTPTFEWKHHVSYNEGVGVAPFKDVVYCAFKNAVIEYDISESSYEEYTSVNYLSDLDITAIKSDNNKYVLIGYSNGNLDLIYNNTFYNLPEILNGNQSGNKSIKDVFFKDDQAYVISGIGVVLYDLKKREVKDYFRPTTTGEVNDMVVYNDSIYVATNSGIYKINESYPFLADVSAWQLHQVFGSSNNAKFNQLETNGTELYTILNSDTYLRDSCILVTSNSAIGVSSQSGMENPKLTAYDQNVIASGGSHIYQLNLGVSTLDFFDYVGSNSTNIANAAQHKGLFWVADKRVGFAKGVNSWSNNIINVNSPYSSSVYGIAASQDRVVVAGGGLFKYTENTYNSSGFYTYHSGSWNNFNVLNSTLISGKGYDYSGAAINPNNSSEYFVFGQSGQALVRVVDGQISDIYEPGNSTLDSVTNYNDVRIGGVEIDDDGYTWVGNSFSTTPLKLKDPNGVWYQASLGSSMSGSIIYDVNIDYFDMKWISSKSGGIAVYDHNRTQTDFSDDQYINITSSNANLPSNTVYCTRMDFDGEVWIGTAEGLAVIYNATDVFSDNANLEASRILVQKENDVEILLGTNAIIDIEIDGANRKWIVVEQSGVICLSPDGTEELYSFNEDNSPLVSNNVTDIEIDHITGEIYIATDKGLMSFRADATQSDNEFESVKVFPNPVLPDFDGSVTVNGLGFNSHVNITDVSGNLVYETTSNGGTVTWNCKTVTGERVPTGVYLFWAGQNEDKGRKVAKVLVVSN